jgi:hypothetical protein
VGEAGEAMSDRLLEGPGPCSTEPNPCVRLWGPGPDGATCKTCAHLVSYQWSKRYYKCDLRRMSACAATDHRVAWRACGKYEVTP